MGQNYESNKRPLHEGSGARNNSNRSPIPPTEIRSSGARNSGGRAPRPPKK